MRSCTSATRNDDALTRASLVAISAVVIVIFLVAVSAIYVIARPAQPC